MAEWIPPKIDYWDTPRPIGGEDLKRIEGNIAALESGKVIPRGVLLRAVSSDAVLLEANTQRYAYHGETKLVKEFALKYPGTYRFKCELRRSGGDTTASASITVSISGGSGGSADVSVDNDNKWQPINFEIGTGVYGSVVRVFLKAPYGGSAYIRNVKICGTLTMTEPPEYAVLLD